MRPIDQETAERYLRETSRVEPGERLVVHELSGGVSNMVLLVDRPDRPGSEFVIKQARGQLRTRDAWFASVERAWREADVLAICARLLDERAGPGGATPAATALTPRILFEDRDNYLFAMTAAPRPHATWKHELLADRVDPRIAAACGRLLGTLHARSWRAADLAARIGDRTLFDELRIDPYYRTLARAHPAIAPAIDRLIASLDRHPRSLVHADFSPKNLLVFSGGLMMVDFETGHFGDPAFDLGFFLSHLVLKACLKIPRHAEYLRLTERFRESYHDATSASIPPEELAGLWTRGVQNFAACTWARLDGKSPVEYLSDNDRRERVRALCREIFAVEPRDWPAVLALCQRTFDETT